MEFKYIIILICIAFAGFLVYKEAVRKDRSRLILRIVASLFMLFAFTALVIPVSYTIKRTEPLHELNLFTGGTELDSVKAINQKYTLDSSLLKENKNLKAKFIPDLSYYLQEHPEIQKINLFGYGLAADELGKLDHYTLAFHPPSIKNGLVSCNWPQQLKSTQSFVIQGTFLNAKNETIKLILKGLGKNLDSIESNPGTLNFSLKTQPKQIGKAVYQLITLKGKDTLSVDPVPFLVETAVPINIMMLSSAPGFESRFLKNWLADHQYQVAFRSQISKNKYTYDFINQKAIDLSHITGSILKNIAVLLIDEEEWNGINANERTVIEQNVANGMGLIVSINEAKALTKKFERYEVDVQHEKPVPFTLIADSSKFNLLPFTQNLFLRSTADQLPLISDALGRIIVNRKMNGLGQILLSTLSSSYQWQLAGKKTDYAKFWSALLSAAARKEQVAQNIRVAPKFTTIGQKSRLIYSGNSNKIPQLSVNGLNINPRQNMELPFEWDAPFWPTESGWIEFNVNQQRSNGFVYQESDWQTLKNYAKLNQTADFIKNKRQNQSKSENATVAIKKEVSKWWFLLLFLLTSGFLWYELRVLANK